MFPLFQTSESMLAVVLCMIAVAFWVQKFKGFRTLGPALFVIVAGIILVNLKIVTNNCPLYGTISTYCIPISISLYLLNVDFKKIVKGFMIESFLEEGNQQHDIVFGKSITDPCLGWADTERLILDIAEKV